MNTIEDEIYLTVKEFAAAANISNKAVYQQLKTRLKEYSKTIDNMTMISERALRAFYSGNSSCQVKSSQEPRILDNSLENNSSERYITYLENEVKELKENLKDRDKAILELQQQIINLSSSLANMSNESLQQISSITKNIQLLQVAEVKDDIINSQETEIIEQPKKSFWNRMRGK